MNFTVKIISVLFIICDTLYLYRCDDLHYLDIMAGSRGGLDYHTQLFYQDIRNTKSSRYRSTTPMAFLNNILSPQQAMAFVKAFVDPPRLMDTVKKLNKDLLTLDTTAEREAYIHRWLSMYINDTISLSSTTKYNSLRIDPIGNIKKINKEPYQMHLGAVMGSPSLSVDNNGVGHLIPKLNYMLTTTTPKTKLRDNEQDTNNPEGVNIDLDIGTDNYDAPDINWDIIKVRTTTTTTSRSPILPRLTRPPESPYEVRVKADMLAYRYTYFRAFTVHICDLLANKDDKAVKDIWLAAHDVVNGLFVNRTLSEIPDQTMHMLLQFLMHMNLISTKEKKLIAANTKTKMFDMTFDAEIVDILWTLSLFHTIEEGEALIDCLVLLYEYPQNDTETAHTVVQTTVDTLLQPYFRMQNESKMRVLLQRIIDLVAQRYPDGKLNFGDQTVTNVEGQQEYEAYEPVNKSEEFNIAKRRDRRTYFDIHKKQAKRNIKNISNRNRFNYRRRHHEVAVGTTFKVKNKNDTRRSFTSYNLNKKEKDIKNIVRDRLNQRRYKIVGNDYKNPYKLFDKVNIKNDSYRIKKYFEDNLQASEERNYPTFHTLATRKPMINNLSKYVTDENVKSSQEIFNTLSNHYGDAIKTDVNSSTTDYKDKRYRIVSARAHNVNQKVHSHETYKGKNILRSQYVSKSPKIYKVDTAKKFEENFPREIKKGGENMGNGLANIRRESSYSDEEKDLMFNLDDALRHGNVNIEQIRRRNLEIEKNKFTDVTSEDDEEGIIKRNVYKVFATTDRQQWT